MCKQSTFIVTVNTCTSAMIHMHASIISACIVCVCCELSSCVCLLHNLFVVLLSDLNGDSSNLYQDRQTTHQMNNCIFTQSVIIKFLVCVRVGQIYSYSQTIPSAILHPYPFVHFW